MNIDRIIFAFAGLMITASLVLSWVHSPYWMWLAAFVGANLLQSSITGFCPAASVLKAVGVKSGNAF